MRGIKLFLVGLIVLTVMVSLFSLLFPSKVKINRDIIVNTAPNRVIPEISNLQNWPRWYAPLLGVNEFIQRSGPGGMPLLIWLDAKDRRHEVLIEHSDSLFAEVKIRLQKNEVLKSRFILHPINNGIQTRIEWQSLHELGWLPWNKFKGIFAEDLIAPVQESSLQKLKSLLEAHHITAGSN